MRGYKIFAGSASEAFAKEVCKYLDVPLAKADIKRFSDGEISVQVSESVRGRDVFIIQSTGAPSNDNLMELLIMTDALRRSSANSITALWIFVLAFISTPREGSSRTRTIGFAAIHLPRRTFC